MTAVAAGLGGGTATENYDVRATCAGFPPVGCEPVSWAKNVWTKIDEKGTGVALTPRHYCPVAQHIWKEKADASIFSLFPLHAKIPLIRLSKCSVNEVLPRSSSSAAGEPGSSGARDRGRGVIIEKV